MSNYESLNEEQRKVRNAGETLADITSIHPMIPIS